MYEFYIWIRFEKILKSVQWRRFILETVTLNIVYFIHQLNFHYRLSNKNKFNTVLITDLTAILRRKNCYKKYLKKPVDYSNSSCDLLFML